jgi:hypothetical protein
VPPPALAPDPAQATAPPPDAGDAGSAGAVPSGGAGGSPGQGVLPPSASPMPQDVPPAGNEAVGMEVMRKITGALHYARMLFGPGSEMLKVVDKLYAQASKHFQPDADTMKGGKMPPLGQIGKPAGGPPGAPPAGGGGPPMGMPGAAPPQGPIPMKGPQP